jgi:hypothetical protein
MRRWATQARTSTVGLSLVLLVVTSEYHVSRPPLPALIRRDTSPQPNQERVAQSHTLRPPWEPRRERVATRTSCVPPWKRSLLGLFPVIIAQALLHIFHPTKGRLFSQPTKKHVIDFSPLHNVSDTKPYGGPHFHLLEQQLCQTGRCPVALSPPSIACVPASFLRKSKTRTVDSATDPVAQAS